MGEDGRRRCECGAAIGRKSTRCRSCQSGRVRPVTGYMRKASDDDRPGSVKCSLCLARSVRMPTVACDGCGGRHPVCCGCQEVNPRVNGARPADGRPARWLGRCPC